MADAPARTDAAERTGLAAQLKSEARRLGFDLVGIVPAVSPHGFVDLKRWLQKGYAGEMQYLSRREAAYEHPHHVLADVKSIVMLALNYRTGEPKPAAVNEARVSRYAWGSGDYHDLLKGKLRQLGDYLHQQRAGCRTRGVADTAPLLERDFARVAGLGWFGKNTMLINKRLGSWLLLAALLVDVELDYDQPHDASHCGTCTRCLDACPTDAFPEPYVLDARKCISYLTIELRDEPIPEGLRADMGAWMFGCDICQDVCPWNNKAPLSMEPAFKPSPDLDPADAVSLLKMTGEEFRERFNRTPLDRPRRAGLLRNAAIVLGNKGDERAVPALIEALDDVEPLIRGASAWALGEIGGEQAKTALQSRLAVEDNAHVLRELRSMISSFHFGVHDG